MGWRRRRGAPVQLARASQLIVYVQAENSAQVAAARRAADEAGLLGSRVYVAGGTYQRLHLAENIADAVVAFDAPAESLRDEALRVLRPGGVALLGSQKIVKPAAPGADEWRHPYHGPDNNPQSSDTIARAPYLTRFLAKPWYGPMPEVTVSSGGRLFKAFGHISFKEREWPLLNKLVCLSSYNGTELWRRRPRAGVHDPPQYDDRHARDAVLGRQYFVQTARRGHRRRARRDSRGQGHRAGGGAWKWMALQGGVLYAMLGEAEQPDETIKGTRKLPGWPWSGLGGKYDKRAAYSWGFGHTLVAIDPQTKKIRWSRQEPETIDGRAIGMSGGRIFYYCHPKLLACLDATDGKTLWRTSQPKVLQAIGEHDGAQNPRLGFSSTSYLKCSDQAIYFAGPQRKRLVAVSAKDGKFLWDYPAGNFQLVLRDDGLYAMGRLDQSKKLDPLTGEVLADLDCLRGNCTRATGTVDAIFSRGHPHTGTLRLDLSSSQSTPTRIPLMRPACQDGVLVSGGQLFWGPWMCDCNLQLVGVISLGPAGAFDFAQQATDAERLRSADSPAPAAFSVTSADWPSYRADNSRSGVSPVSLAKRIRKSWLHESKSHVRPAAPIAAGGLVFLSGADGVGSRRGRQDRRRALERLHVGRHQVSARGLEQPAVCRLLRRLGLLLRGRLGTRAVAVSRRAAGTHDPRLWFAQFDLARGQRRAGGRRRRVRRRGHRQLRRHARLRLGRGNRQIALAE